MRKAILKYKSDPKVYDIQNESIPSHEMIGDLFISEHFLQSERYKYISSSLGDYQLTIETEVDNTLGIQSKYFKIKRLINELDRSWMYACGHPLNKKVLSFTGPYIDFPDGNISGWKSNYREIEKEINKGKAHAVCHFEKVSHSSFPYWPLKKALHVRESYLAASKPIKALVDLHYFAHKIGDSYSSFFFLAKSLEIVRALLPGKTDSEKENGLPDNVRSKLKTSLHEIAGLANSRYELRHIVKDKKNISLHEKMNHSEIEAFKHDVDLIIRFVVSDNLDIMNLSIMD